MTRNPTGGRPVLNQDDLRFLKEVHSSWCKEKKIDANGPLAEDKAISLLDLFDVGIMDRSALADAITSKRL